MQRHLDLLVLGDPRFIGGTGTAMAQEIRAAVNAGYRVGLLCVEAAVLRRLFLVNPQLKAMIAEGRLELLAPDAHVSAKLAIAHNPMAFTCTVPVRPRIEVEQALMVAHHPPRLADGTLEYEIDEVDRNVAELVECKPLWVPVGHKVRHQLEHLDHDAQIGELDWHNVIDIDDWQPRPERPMGEIPVIGRHSRPDWRKWPDDRAGILQAWPSRPDIEVRVLGAGAELRKRLRGYPRNWKVLAFGEMPVNDFLQGLDAFVYFHHSRWIEAFGYAIAEAMAAGLPTILPPDFKPLFGSGAIYCERHEVVERVMALRDDPHGMIWQSRQARDYVDYHFGPKALIGRLEALIGPPEAPPAPRPGTAVAKETDRDAPLPLPAAIAARPQPVMFLTSNGVGMGHLTRMLAVARRLEGPFEPFFVTLSQAMRLVEGMGYPTEYIPDYSYVGSDRETWNHYLHQELNEIVGFYRPRVVLFDSHNPYEGVVRASLDNRETFWIWSRRAMWPYSGGRNFIERESAFDGVIEPEDLAGEYDVGPTVARREHIHLVPPIRLLDDAQMLGRDAARAELGLDPDRPAILLLLGSGNTADFKGIRTLFLRALERRPDVQVAVLEWMIANEPAPLPDSVIRLQRYPMAKWMKAFDGAVSAAGYNSFHELVLAGIPTVFVPNEHPMMENQLGRALWAERQRLALCLRLSEQHVYRIDEAVAWLLDKETAGEVRARAAGLDRRNGAGEVAALIREMLILARVDRRRKVFHKVPRN